MQARINGLVKAYFPYVKPTPELRDAFITFHNFLRDDSIKPTPGFFLYLPSISDWRNYLDALNKLVRPGLACVSILPYTNDDITLPGF